MADHADLVERDNEWIEQSNLIMSKNMDRPGKRCHTPDCGIIDDSIILGYALCDTCREKAAQIQQQQEGGR